MKTKTEVKELRELSKDALLERIRSVEEEMMNMRFRNASGQLENPAHLGVLRKNIARMKTLLNEKRV